MAGREKVDFKLKCPECEKEGMVTIEEDENPVYERGSTIVSVSKGFKASPKHDTDRHLAVICCTCKVVVPY
jgi:hypothetical protein